MSDIFSFVKNFPDDARDIILRADRAAYDGSATLYPAADYQIKFLAGQAEIIVRRR